MIFPIKAVRSVLGAFNPPLALYFVSRLVVEKEGGLKLAGAVVVVNFTLSGKLLGCETATFLLNTTDFDGFGH